MKCMGDTFLYDQLMDSHYFKNIALIETLRICFMLYCVQILLIQSHTFSGK